MKTLSENEVCVENDIFSIENLPLPVALYPEHYGIYIAFKKSIEDPKIYLCDCCKVGLENYLKIVLNNDGSMKTDSYGYNNLIRDYYFPKEFFDYYFTSTLPLEELLHRIQYLPHICHRCNKLTPKYSYCIPMYGSKFIQHFGWYVNQNYFNHGIFEETISKDLIPFDLYENVIRIEAFKDLPQTENIQKKITNELNVIKDYCENEVRIDTGYKQKGQGWVSETLLYHLVKKLYPKQTIYFHYRPDFLDGLELDIFIKEKNIAIEYQGRQHFEPIEFFGGKESFIKQQKNDNKKLNICKSLKIPLIYFDYKDDLSEELVQKRLSKVDLGLELNEPILLNTTTIKQSQTNTISKKTESVPKSNIKKSKKSIEKERRKALIAKYDSHKATNISHQNQIYGYQNIPSSVPRSIKEITIEVEVMDEVTKQKIENIKRTHGENYTYKIIHKPIEENNNSNSSDEPKPKETGCGCLILTVIVVFLYFWLFK